ncbi:MAG: rod shape-determining protein RodA, rod shape determining protein RodA [Chloroflexi bacterium CSP1-4]|nr:MAG: rod shape-determining protein RodA, rod shape determining protein RodA [Chloroflexi bacterium CSP1-4]
MGTLRLEPTRVQAWAARSATAVWNAFDVQLVIYALLLAVIGLLMAYTNSGDTPLAAGSTFARGLIWLAIAIVAFALTAAFDYRWLKTFAWPLYFVNMGLLVTSLLIGDGVGGVARWVTIFGLQFQFSELAKILMIVVLANWIASRQGARLHGLATIVGASVLVVPALVLVLMQPDLGTSIVFGAILVGTLFMAGASLRWLLVLGGAATASLPFIWSYVLLDYQRGRLLSFLDPKADPLGSGYHLIQSQIAVGSGGLFGRGITNGTQNQLDFLPVQSTDFVFAILSEELGFVGGLLVFALFVALLWRVLLVGWRAEDPFALAFAGGLASMILFQLLVNVGMVIGIMPITGIPLPFITHGGASLISIAVGLGILQSINLRQARPTW